MVNIPNPRSAGIKEDQIISYAEFEDVYGGLVVDDEDLVAYYDNFNDEDEREIFSGLLRENRIWTEYDNGYMENYAMFVNRFRYVVSQKAYGNNISIIVDPPWPPPSGNDDQIDLDVIERHIDYMATCLAVSHGERRKGLANTLKAVLLEVVEYLNTDLEDAKENEVDRVVFVEALLSNVKTSISLISTVIGLIDSDS